MFDLVDEPFTMVETNDVIFYLIGDRVIQSSDVLHIKAWTRNAETGENPLQLLNSTFKRGISEIQTYSDFYKNGANISGILHTDTPLNPTQRKELEEAWNKNYGGVSNQGKTALLSQR